MDSFRTGFSTAQTPSRAREARWVEDPRGARASCGLTDAFGGFSVIAHHEPYSPSSSITGSTSQHQFGCRWVALRETLLVQADHHPIERLADVAHAVLRDDPLFGGNDARLLPADQVPVHAGVGRFRACDQLRLRVAEHAGEAEPEPS